MRAGPSIGDFSQITHLSVKTLRRYHEAGLLQPAEVDPHTGYRYYGTTQVPPAQVIRRFRELGMPVREVGEVLATTDPQARSTLIAAHLERLKNQLGQTPAAVTPLRHEDRAGGGGSDHGAPDPRHRRPQRTPRLVRRGHGRTRPDAQDCAPN